MAYTRSLGRHKWILAQSSWPPDMDNWWPKIRTTWFGTFGTRGLEDSGQLGLGDSGQRNLGESGQPKRIKSLKLGLQNVTSLKTP